MSWNRVAVVGAGLIKFGELHQQSFEQMAAGALEAALASVDKGMSRAAIDFAVVATQRTDAVGPRKHLGQHPAFRAGTERHRLHPYRKRLSHR